MKEICRCCSPGPITALSPPNRPAPAPGTGRGRRARSRATARSSSPTGSGGPIAQGRGYAVAVARSADGERFETAGDHRQGRDGHRVAGAAGAGPHARGTLAAVPELRDHGDQALAGGGDRGRPPGRVRRQEPADRAARRRQDRREGPGDRVPPRPVAPVGVLPPAGRPAADRPDDHRVRDQRRRPDLDMARHRAERDAGPVGLPRRAGRRGALRRGRGHRPATTAGPAPRRTTRSGPGSPPVPTRPRSPPSATGRSPGRRTRAAACGTWTSCRCRTGGTGSTTR